MPAGGEKKGGSIYHQQDEGEALPHVPRTMIRTMTCRLQSLSTVEVPERCEPWRLTGA
jgi:hypothetical protein